MGTTNKLKDSRREVLYGELHALLTAGIDFSHAFVLLIDGEEDRSLRGLLERLYAKIVGGGTLCQAMKECGSFSSMECGVVRIGEETGRLAESLDFLRDFYHKSAEHKRMVSSAVSYPLVILGMAVVVVIFMLAVIVPMFEQVYARMGGELPALTQWIIGLSKSFPLYGTVILLAVATAGGLLYRFRHDERVRARSATFILRIPVVGGIVRRHYQSHFCKLLYLLSSSGVPLLEGITMLPEVITFYPYQQSFARIGSGLEQGESFAANVGRYPGLYDRKLAALIRVGEETNRLPEMLSNQADALTHDLEYRIRQLGSMLEPVLILFVGVLVAVILISMYMPMFRLGGIMG